MKNSWKTSLAGLAALLTALGTIAKAAAAGGLPAVAGLDWPSLTAAISAGIGLIAARDHDVSSEDAGIK